MSRAAITKCMAGQHVLSHTDGPVGRVHLCTKDARCRMGCPERGMMPRKKQREHCQMQGGGGVSTGINAPKICSRRISRCVTPIAQTTNSRCIRAMQLILRVAVAPGSPRTTDATIMTPLYDYHRPDYCSLQPSRGRRCDGAFLEGASSTGPSLQATNNSALRFVCRDRLGDTLFSPSSPLDRLSLTLEPCCLHRVTAHGSPYNGRWLRR